MQSQLAGAGTALEIRILGVNEAGQESANGIVVAGRTIPWLQETAEEKVWTTWRVTYRDVIILDGENRPVGVYNLTSHDLAAPANFDSLKSMLVEAAQP